MTNLSKEICLLLKDIFYELPNNINSFLPIVKSSDKIKNVIPFLLTYDTNKEEDINQNINFLFILKEFFNINNNLIPLFMKNSIYYHNKSFYDCLLTLYLNENINDDDKLILEELINYINENYSISKQDLAFIYQELSKYFKNEAKIKLTESLLYRYLNLLNHIYTDKISINKDKNKKKVKNYIYFNGINSGLSFMINKNSCNVNTDFPTLEKGNSFVFWIKLERKLIEEYFKILPDKTYISFIKLNIGGDLILFQLINPDIIRLSCKDNSTNEININSFFNYNEWNTIIFIIEPNKGAKIPFKIYINSHLLNFTLNLKQNINPKEKINSINLFENLLGKISSVISFSFVIDTNLINYFTSIKGFNKKSILKGLFNSFDKEYYSLCIKNKKDKKYFIEKLNKKIKIKLNDQNINNLICCFTPLTYEKNKNIIDDVFGNFIGKLNNDDGVNNFINKNKNIRDLGGINTLLPIIELMLCSLKENNPYQLIDKNILTEKTFQEFLLIIQKILLDHENNITNERKTKFFYCFSLFMENIPSKFYTINILQSIIALINLPIENKPTKNIINLNNTNENINVNLSINPNNFINLILLNERIITKFPPKAQMELWDGLFEVFNRDLIRLQKIISTPKICLLLRFYDEQRYEKFCCYKHACLFNNGNLFENKQNIMDPEMNIKVEKLFDIIQLYLDFDNEESQIEDIFKLLSLDLSPCLQKKIINLYISHFTNPKISEKKKTSTLNYLLKNNYIELSEYVLKISLLDVRIDIFKLLKLFTANYKTILEEHFKKYSIDISQVICFYGFNILPDKSIIEIDSPKENAKKGNLITIHQIKKETTINEELLNKDKKYVHLVDFFDENEYQKDIKVFWDIFNTSFKYELTQHEKKNKIKGRAYILDPFVFNFSIDFASKVSTFYVDALLISLFAAIKDESIVNRNIFYTDKIFFPWLVDTIFYFHNQENYEYIKEKDFITSIKGLSINILCELFSHHRENEEIFKRLKYILDYSYYYKRINKGNSLKEIIRITRYILLKIFECFKEYIDIKSKLSFEFMFLYKNSEQIFNEEELHFKEIQSFPEKDFLEIEKKERVTFSTWETLDNNNQNNNNIEEENIYEEDEDNINIGSINDNIGKNKEIRSITMMSNNKNNNNNNEIIIGDINLIPDYIYDGINYIDQISFNDNNEQNNNLENTWSDYKLFYYINEYYRKNLWGIEILCKKPKVDNKLKDFTIIVKELYRFYGEIKNNKNYLIQEISKYFNYQEKRKYKLNIFYINLILLSIAIDICENNEEKENLYYQYEQYLLFFILASVNLSSPPNDNKTKIFEKMFYNIIGYGFLYLKKRDEEKYNEIKSILINPIFEHEGKNIFGIPKKTFLKKSVIGKLFSSKNSSKDDTNISKNQDITMNIKDRRTVLSRSTRAVTSFSKKNEFLFNKNNNSNQDNDNDSIKFIGDSKLIINEIIENTVNCYKNSKSVMSNSQILKFYTKHDEKEEKSGKSHFIGMGSDELNKKIINEEKRIFRTVKETIPFLADEIRKYWNNSVLDQLKRRREYKKTKKKLFSWNGFWSDRKLFFEHPEYLKLQVKNHFTKEMTKVILTPILDIDYYLPNFSKFNKDKLFNKDDYKYKIFLNVEEILKLSDDKKNDNQNKEVNIINKKEENIINNKEEKNIINNEEEKNIINNEEEKNIINNEEENNIINNEEKEKKVEENIKEKDEKKKDDINIKENLNINNQIEDDKNDNTNEVLNINKQIEKESNNNINENININKQKEENKPKNIQINKFSDKIKFLNQRLSLTLKNPNPNMPSIIKKNSTEKNIEAQNIINENKINNNISNNNNNNKIIENQKVKEKKIINKKDIKNCLSKDFNYLESLYKFTFKGIWDQYNKFYKGKMTLGNIILGNKDAFDILIQSKIMSSSEENKMNENLYICCIVKPTHHVKGYMSTEKTSIKFTHCDEDEESQRLLENDPSYDKELKCCFGSTFKSHIKDREKVCIEIKYTDMRYILFRNYFYQETACEIYTFSNKSYFLNFKDNNELQKFISNILNHELFRPIKCEDFKGKKVLGYEKTSDAKAKSFKVKKLMEEWQNNNISTLQYIMWLNIFAGRSFNDVTQYPVVPWLITNYEKDELSQEDFRNLSIPVGMMEVSEKAEARKETFIEFYDTLKTDFKEANPDFNYNEYLKKADEYFEDYKIKKNKKKNNNNNTNDLGLNDINISSIELNQIPYFYGTHYSCPTFISHYLMRIFPFSLLSIEIQGDKFDDPDRIFISLTRTFETASTLKEDVRELIPEFYTLPEMFLNKNNLNLTQDKLDAEGNKIVVHDVELPPWCNNISYNFISEMRRNLEKNELKINKWIDLIFGSLQRGEKAEENHNIFMAQSYEGMVKINTVTDYDTRNALMRLCEVGVTPKQIFKVDTKQRNEKIEAKGKLLYESQKLNAFKINSLKYDETIKKLYINKSINKEYEVQIYPKIIKIKWIGLNELLLLNNFNYLTRLKFKKALDKEKYIIEEKSIINAINISSKYAPSYFISHQNPPILFYNKNKYMIKGGFWDGRLEINTMILDPKEKEKHFSKFLFIKEGPVVAMEMSKDEKILLCGTKTGYLICLSVDGSNLEIDNKIYLHNDEITSININDNLNMFSTSSLDGYINIHILPSYDLVRSIKISLANKNILYGNSDDELYYANNVFLSSSPLPCVTAFISSKRIFRTYTINGEFVQDTQETDNSNYIKCPIIFNDLNFQEYLIYGTDDGRIKTRRFPNMELINNVIPCECNEIISMDISADKRYCYLWMKGNQIIAIKDFGVDVDEDEKKRIEKLAKENGKEKEKKNE